MKITFETKAWIGTYNHATPEELRTESGASSLYYSPRNLGADYTFAGDATVTLDLLDTCELVDNKISALREQAKNIRAEATAQCTRIEGQIQQLLCIENSPSEPT